MLAGFAIEGFVLSAILVHMVPLTAAVGLGTAGVFVASLFGPLAGRQPLHQHAVRRRRAADLAGGRRDRLIGRRPGGAASHRAVARRRGPVRRPVRVWDPG